LKLIRLSVLFIQNFKLDDQTSNVDQNQIDLIANLSEFLANLLTIYNSKMNEIYKHNEQTNEEKLFISRLSDLIRLNRNKKSKIFLIKTLLTLVIQQILVFSIESVYFFVHHELYLSIQQSHVYLTWLSIYSMFYNKCYNFLDQSMMIILFFCCWLKSHYPLNLN